MKDDRFTNRELDEKFDRLEEKLDEHAITHQKILDQVTYTNGKVRKLTFFLTIIGTATMTLLFTRGSELVGFIKLII